MKTCLLAYTDRGTMLEGIAKMIASIAKAGRQPDKYGDDFVMDKGIHYVFKTIPIPNFADQLRGYDEVRCKQIMMKLQIIIGEIGYLTGKDLPDPKTTPPPADKK